MTTTLTERAQSFGHLFVERVAKTPNGEAYRYLVGGEWQSLTWTQTKDRVFRIAAGLIDLGVQPQQRVAIAATTRIEWILADLATLCAGGATTTRLPVDRRSGRRLHPRRFRIGGGVRRERGAGRKGPRRRPAGVAGHRAVRRPGSAGCARVDECPR